MTNESNRTHVPSEDFISETALRGVFGRRRRRRVTASEAHDTLPTAPPELDEGTSPPAPRARTLRRWSVAELVARAAGTPPRTA